MRTNTQVRLVRRPVGEPSRDDFEIASSPLSAPGPGQVLVKVLYVSLDPAMRGWMNEGRSYIEPVPLGEVMRALGAGRVVASGDPAFSVGDYVTGLTGVQEYALVEGHELTKVDPDLAPLPAFLHVLGMTGMTAYFGLLKVGRPKEGETVVVSAAAGAVGSVVGQIAKLKGCRVVGIAGGRKKCDYLVQELGFDAAVDYKQGNLKSALRAACPDGVDVFFDNVGGDILDTVLTRLRLHARVVICGAISQYNNTEPVKGPSNYLSLLVNRARMEGMVVFDYRDRFAQAVAEMAGWMAAGKLRHREHIVHGLETFPERLLMLFRGENFGKLVLAVARDD